MATGAAPAAAPSGYTAVSPVRVLDTRSGVGGWRRLPAGEGTTIEVDPLAVAGIAPAGVTAVALNLTAVGPTASGWATTWPTSTPRPISSSLNFPAGATVPNLVVAQLGASSRVNVLNARGQTHYIADLVGVFSTSGGQRLVPVSPFRLLDTRSGRGAPATRLAAGQTLNVQVTGVTGSGVPATGVGAVALNVTVTGPSSAGWMTVWPAGEARPNASNLNYAAGQTVPNLVITKVGAGGKVSITNSTGATHVIADVVGYFAAGGTGQYTPLTPARVLDTRSGIGAPKALVGTGGIALAVAGVGGVPASGATSAVLNVTVVGPTANGWVTVWPSGESKPNASSLNYVTNQTIANAVLAKLGTDGKVRLSASGATNLLADVVGYFT